MVSGGVFRDVSASVPNLRVISRVILVQNRIIQALRVAAVLIGYARVSTDEQNLDLQLNALRSAGCARIFTDVGVSGKATRRAGLDGASRMLKADDTLVVWRLDRLGRSLSHLIRTINHLERQGVHFRSLSETIDTGSSGGRLVFHMMGAMAEFEHALISERTRAGMKAAKQLGRRVGRPPALGPEQESEIMHALYGGQSTSQLAKRFGVSSRTITRLRQKTAPQECRLAQVET